MATKHYNAERVIYDSLVDKTSRHVFKHKTVLVQSTYLTCHYFYTVRVIYNFSEHLIT